MAPVQIFRTGQTKCYDSDGLQIPCSGTGQDAEFMRGAAWPHDRFLADTGLVSDRMTGLVWARNANLADFPLTWEEALHFVSEMNNRQMYGIDSWRLPNRKEMMSLLSYQAKNPALPENHPFDNVFLAWYWTSSSAAVNPAYAWYIHMEGARTFYGKKNEYHLLWPVSGSASVLLNTGQRKCYDSGGFDVPCPGTGQDGEFQYGRTWSEARFEEEDDIVNDTATHLIWTKKADAGPGPGCWQDAFYTVKELNAGEFGGIKTWRLPNIQELESLVDLSAFGPALSPGHPFLNLAEVYWSSTTSAFATEWAWALYMYKGAVGVGLKKRALFHTLAVADDSAGKPGS